MLALVFALPLALAAPSLRAPAAPLPQSQPAHVDDVAAVRAKLAEAQGHREAGEHERARAEVVAAVDDALVLHAKQGDGESLTLLFELGRFAYLVGELRAAERARRAVLESAERLLPEEHPQLQGARLELGLTLRRLGDLEGALALEQRAYEILSRTVPDTHPNLQVARIHLATTLKQLGDLQRALALEREAVEIFSRSLPPEHPRLLSARQNLATTLKNLGDLQGALALEESVLAARERTLPEDHRDLLIARGNLARTRKSLGDLHGALALEESVLAAYERTLPENHDSILTARQSLAATLAKLGELQEARALQEAVLEARSQALPGDHPTLQTARLDLATILTSLGELEQARALQEAALEVFARTRPADDPNLLSNRNGLAVTLYRLGELREALAILEHVHDVRTRTLPGDHPDLQATREMLAIVLKNLGDPQRARSLEERVLEVRERTLPTEHRDLQATRFNLAVTLKALGDLQGARALEAAVLDSLSRTLPERHPDRLAARQNLAATLAQLGDLDAARELLEAVIEDRERTQPSDAPDLLKARHDLAVMLRRGGAFRAAAELEEDLIEVLAVNRSEDHTDLLRARFNHALTLKALGELDASASLLEEVHEVVSRTRPADDPLLLATRSWLVRTLAQRGARDEAAAEDRRRCAELADALSDAQVAAARSAVLSGSVREAEERCASLSKGLGTVLSCAEGYGVFPPNEELVDAAFRASETSRGAGLAVTEWLSRAAGHPEYASLRDELRRASGALAASVREGGSSAAYEAARARREELERTLSELARELLADETDPVALDAPGVLAHLAEREVAVAFRRYRRSTIHRAVDGALDERIEESLGAFVLRGSAGDGAEPALDWVRLGPIGAVEGALREGRAGLGSALDRGVGLGAGVAAGTAPHWERVRELVWDPLLPHVEDAERVVVVLDDVLHLVPLDALPLEDGERLVGDRWRIEIQVTLRELLRDAPEPAAEPGQLFALGGPDFDAGPEEVAPGTAASLPPAAAVASLLRNSAWEQGFNALPGAEAEVREVAARYIEVLGSEEAALVLTERQASLRALEELAPRARWLHVATHGWFAPESTASWEDVAPIDGLGDVVANASSEAVVRGTSPLLLCGLALAGANLPADAAGGSPGLVTAEELSTLDLARCELAVLSACDTNVGERRAGQGVASLQKALHMAGARTVIASLWKVPDDATRALMNEFYRRLWVEGLPKARALWEAKRAMREARDGNGRPRYALRDWAGWVLTGAPD